MASDRDNRMTNEELDTLLRLMSKAHRVMDAIQAKTPSLEGKIQLQRKIVNHDEARRVIRSMTFELLDGEPAVVTKTVLA